MNSQDFIKKINEYFQTNLQHMNPSKHILVKEQLDTDEWVKDGSPYCWILVKETNDIQMYISVSHGLLALFDGKDFSYTHGECLVFKNYMAIWKDYYGSEYELFKAVE